MSCNFAIKKIRLTMSDRETIEIDGKHIGAFTVGEIERSAKTLGCNGFGILDLAGFVMLELHKDADLLYASFTNKNGTDKVFERLERKWDITALEIWDSNNELYRYNILWRADSGEENAGQDVYIGKNRNLYMVVSNDGRCVETEFEDTTSDNWGWFREEWGSGKKTKGDIMRLTGVKHLPTDSRLNEPCTEEFEKECLGCPQDMPIEKWLQKQVEKMLEEEGTMW